jgi:hypothetical protein
MNETVPRGITVSVSFCRYPLLLLTPPREKTREQHIYYNMRTSSATRKHNSVTSSTSTDKTRNKMADPRQGTDEMLGRYSTLLSYSIVQ